MKKDSAEAQKIVVGFLKYLETNKKTALLPEIVSILTKRGYGGSKETTVYSATPLSASQKKSIEEILMKEYEVEEISFEIDENIVGGLKVVIGNQVLDLSYRAKLDQLTAGV